MGYMKNHVSRLRRQTNSFDPGISGHKTVYYFWRIVSTAVVNNQPEHGFYSLRNYGSDDLLKVFS